MWCAAVKVVREEQTQQLLMCIAYVFEVLTSERTGPQHHVYRLVGQWYAHRLSRDHSVTICNSGYDGAREKTLAGGLLSSPYSQSFCHNLQSLLINSTFQKYCNTQHSINLYFWQYFLVNGETHSSESEILLSKFWRLRCDSYSYYCAGKSYCCDN